MQVREVMTRSPICCPPDMSLRDVARLMVEFDCGEIPVVDRAAHRPIGVVTDRDITCRAVAKGQNPLEMTARDCMTSPVVTVTADATIEECCRTMEAHQIRRVPVVDAGGSCCGIVAQADVALRTPGEQAAEVVKEISRHVAAPAQPAASMATDPVCGIHVETSTTEREQYASMTYYFCSAECHRKFNRRRDDYVAPAEAGM